MKVQMENFVSVSLFFQCTVEDYEKVLSCRVCLVKDGDERQCVSYQGKDEKISFCVPSEFVRRYINVMDYLFNGVPVNINMDSDFVSELYHINND